MTDVKTFQSEKDFTRLDYLNKALIFIGILVISHFLYIFKHPNRDTSGLALYFIEAIMGLIILTWIFTKKITREITIDYSAGQFIVKYMTLLKSDNNLRIPLSDINFKFDKEPSFRQPQKMTLKVLRDRKLVFEISVGEDGFSQQTLTRLSNELAKASIQ